jgi:MFS family permease
VAILATQHPRFGRLTLAIGVSSLGDPITLTLAQVLLYRQTHSPFALAGVYLSEMVAALLVGLVAGTITDRLDRRRLIVTLELVRTGIVVLLPVATLLSPFTLYPALFLVGAVEAIVQPARLAGVPGLVGAAHLERANASLVLLLSLGQAAGFALAGVLIGVLPEPRLLFLVDAATFAAAAALVMSVGPMGGGATAARLSGTVFRALASPRLRPQLLIAGAVTFCAMLLPPSLLPLSYQLSSDPVRAYAWLEVLLIVGLTVGALAAYRIKAGFGVLTVSLWIFGFGALGAGLAHNLWLTGAGIAISAIGNALYYVANQSALLKAADENSRGSVMSARYTVVQFGRVLGLAAGAAMTAAVSGAFTVTMVGVLLLPVAFVVGRLWIAGRRDGPGVEERAPLLDG